MSAAPETATTRGIGSEAYRRAIIEELNDAPSTILTEVLDFLRQLKRNRASKGLENYLASEALLAEDWLSPEEDEAWQDL